MAPPTQHRSDRVLETLRERQRQIEGLYELEAGPDIGDFVRFDEAQPRETVLVKQGLQGIELALVLPTDLRQAPGALSDDHLQLIEGASHFVLLAERARTELPATRLELELQAEVDKFAVLLELTGPSTEEQLWRLHRWLFEQVVFIDAANTESGQRYRIANDLAARLCARLSPDRHARTSRALLKRFYRSGQAEKIRLASAA